MVDEYKSVPLYLRSRVEGWEIKCNDLTLGDPIGIEQIGVRHKACWKTLAVDVKLLSLPNLSQSEDNDEEYLIEELFLIEIDVMSKLRHPNIVSFLGACLDMEDDGNLMLLTEHMAGGSLESALARGRANVRQTATAAWVPPRRQALSWSLQLAQALNYLHQCRPVLVHRDLCPARLLLTASGQLKIAGFSYCAAPRDWSTCAPSSVASSWLVPLDASYSAADLPDAARQQLALARPYAAPEVAGVEGLDGGFWDERADVYSMSVIVWELVTGEAPAACHPVAAAGRLWPGRRGWEGLEALLQRGRAVEPGARCSVEEAVEVLEGLSAQVAADDASALCGAKCRMS